MFFWMQQKCVELYVQCGAGELHFRLNIDFDTVNYLSPFNLINFSSDILCFTVCACIARSNCNCMKSVERRFKDIQLLFAFWPGNKIVFVCHLLFWNNIATTISKTAKKQIIKDLNEDEG